jgi:uncharacterized protein (TIGR02118 family)
VSVIVIEFITLDGIVSDPDGSEGTPAGGWAFRHGPETVAGDKFRLGTTLDEGIMLLGRTTWQLFSRIWPGRDSPFAARMNAVPKLVASRALADREASGRHYNEVHIPLMRRLPGLRRYTVGRDVAALYGAPCHLIAELEWDTMDGLRAAFASAEGRATAADAARLQEPAPVRRMICTVDEA